MTQTRTKAEVVHLVQETVRTTGALFGFLFVVDRDGISCNKALLLPGRIGDVQFVKSYGRSLVRFAAELAKEGVDMGAPMKNTGRPTEFTMPAYAVVITQGLGQPRGRHLRTNSIVTRSPNGQYGSSR